MRANNLISKLPEELYAYNSESVVFNIGPDKDSYTIESRLTQNVEDNSVKIVHTVVKNCLSAEKPSDPSKITEGRKYRETILTTTVLKHCYVLIQDIVKNQGYWDEDPEDKITFRKIFFPPVKQ